MIALIMVIRGISFSSFFSLSGNSKSFGWFRNDLPFPLNFHNWPVGQNNEGEYITESQSVRGLEGASKDHLVNWPIFLRINYVRTPELVLQIHSRNLERGWPDQCLQRNRGCVKHERSSKDFTLFLESKCSLVMAMFILGVVRCE